MMIKLIKNFVLFMSSISLFYSTSLYAQQAIDLTDLMFAARNGDKKTVETLVAKGAKIDAKTNQGWTALMFAAENGYANIVETLLKAGSKINTKDLNGNTPLILSSKGGHFNTVKVLLNYGAKTNFQDIYGWTALMRSVENGYTNIVKILVRAGSDINIQSKDGDTAVSIADQRNNKKIVELLLKAGAKPLNNGNKKQIYKPRIGISGEFLMGYHSLNSNDLNEFTDVNNLPDVGQSGSIMTFGIGPDLYWYNKFQISCMLSYVGNISGFAWDFSGGNSVDLGFGVVDLRIEAQLLFPSLNGIYPFIGIGNNLFGDLTDSDGNGFTKGNGNTHFFLGIDIAKKSGFFAAPRITESIFLAVRFGIAYWPTFTFKEFKLEETIPLEITGNSFSIFIGLHLVTGFN